MYFSYFCKWSERDNILMAPGEKTSPVSRYIYEGVCDFSDITHLLKSEEAQNSEWFSSFFWKEINLTATLFYLNLIDDRFPHGCTLR